MENPDELSHHHDTKHSLFKRGAHLPDSQKPMDLPGVSLATEMPSLPGL